MHRPPGNDLYRSRAIEIRVLVLHRSNRGATDRRTLDRRAARNRVRPLADSRRIGTDQSATELGWSRFKTANSMALTKGTGPPGRDILGAGVGEGAMTGPLGEQRQPILEFWEVRRRGMGGPAAGAMLGHAMQQMRDSCCVGDHKAEQQGMEDGSHFR